MVRPAFGSILLLIVSSGVLAVSGAASIREVTLEGKYPQLVADGDRIWMISAVRVAKGQDLMLYQLDAASLRVTSSSRVNRKIGQVRVTGESSAQLLKATNRGILHAIWNESDPRHQFANRLVSASYDIASAKWSAPIVVNDDPAPTTHSFQDAAVAPDGAIHVAWIDRRHNAVKGPDDYSGGGDHSTHGIEPDASLYYARSTDNGKSYDKNRHITGGVCACCRIAIAVENGLVAIAWRSVRSNGARDIALSVSSNGGNTWSTPHVPIADNWLISGCPHAGPALGFIGSTLYLSWMTGVSGGPVVRIAASADSGTTFGKPMKVRGPFYNSNHPRLAVLDDKVFATFEGLDSDNNTRIFVARADGFHESGISDPQFASLVRGPASYPAITLDRRGFVVAWTESSGESSSIRLARR